MTSFKAGDQILVTKKPIAAIADCFDEVEAAEARHDTTYAAQMREMGCVLNRLYPGQPLIVAESQQDSGDLVAVRIDGTLVYIPPGYVKHR